METHIMHTFKEDFYGEILNVAIVGYLRPERNFDSLESLISAIHGDIEEAKKRLDLPEHLKLKEDSFFQVAKSKIMNGHWWKIILFIHSLFSCILLLITVQSNLGSILKIKPFPTAVN